MSGRMISSELADSGKISCSKALSMGEIQCLRSLPVKRQKGVDEHRRL